MIEIGILMRHTSYSSVRTGKSKPNNKLDLSYLKRLFLDLYTQFENKNYFQEAWI